MDRALMIGVSGITYIYLMMWRLRLFSRFKNTPDLGSSLSLSHTNTHTHRSQTHTHVSHSRPLTTPILASTPFCPMRGALGRAR